ncbi:MAG TPA: VOC family protein [Vicinamibacterales bacterium]|nr:VOC family protein [Vicinamibacterales bacterium]
MCVSSFSHVGITVRDFNETVRFYWEMFGCPLVGVSDADPNRVRGFFGVDAPDAKCKIGWIRVPGGGVIEIFEFNPQLPHADVPWQRVGLTHFSLRVTNIQKWYTYLKGKGVTVLGQPEQSPNGGQRFFFIKDCDGNLIEIMDLRMMHYVLQWLGPLGGFLARHGWVRDYSAYYQPKRT